MSTPSRLTWTELFIIFVSLAALAAIAYPRFMGSQNTQVAMNNHTGIALSSALESAHAKWQVIGEQDALIDLNGKGVGDTIFNEKGWPVGISADGQNTLSKIGDKGAIGHDACGQLLHKLLPNQKISIIPANDQGICRSGDVCAKSMAKHQCEYTVRATNEVIYYDANSGKVDFTAPK